MDKKIIIGIIVVVVLVLGGIGGFFYLQSQQEVSVPTPTVAPVVKQEVQPILSVSGPSSLVASQSATIDIFVDTKGVKVDGFQFIATLDGTATPVVVDSDPIASGVQIVAETIPELTIATNSVVDQSGKQVVRFAMITSAGTTGYSTSGPVKVASVPVMPGSQGSLTLTFNPQNSRASKSTGGDDALFDVSDKTFTVASNDGATTATAQATPPGASSSATLAQAPPTTTLNPACRLSCSTDNDCAAGLTCEFGLCVNPACSSSQTCSCSAPIAPSQATPVPLPPGLESASNSALVAQSTTSTSSAATVTSLSSATVTPTPRATVPASTLSGELALSQEPLPVSGSVENTLLLLGAGFLFIGLGFVFAK